MEEPPGKPLSCEEKEKLKEKLAFLRKEYSKTLARLQRAQRAEKGRNSVQKTPKAPDCPAQQEVPPRLGHAEPKTAVSSCNTLPVSTHVSEEAGGAETESCNPGPGPVAGLSVQGTDDIQERLTSRVSSPDGEKRQSKVTGRRKQQRKGAFIAQERDSFFDADSRVLAGKRLREAEDVPRESPRTPVTEIRSHLSGPQSDVPGSPVTETDGGGVSVPALAKAQGAVHTLGRGQRPRPTPLPARAPSGVSGGQHLRPEPPERNCELTSLGLKTVSPPAPVHVEAADRTMTASAGNPEVSKATGARGQRPRSPDLEADGARPINELTGGTSPASQSRSGPEQNLTERRPRSPSNVPGSRAERPWEDAGLSPAESLGPAGPSPAAAENPALSCTVLEGLLFPAEYYVRTTRHMSHRQRKVALEAVIQSHLGARKKGNKNKNREAAKNVKLPAGGANRRGGRISDPCPGPPGSRSPSHRRCSVADVHAPAAPAGGDFSGRAPVLPSGRRHSAGRRAVLTSPLSHQLLAAGVTSGVNGTREDVAVCRDQSAKAVVHEKEGRCRKADSPPSRSQAHVALGDRVSCAPSPKRERLGLKPLSLLRITDFQLPDEDFGPLKLEKLRSSSEKLTEPLGSQMCGGRHLKEATRAVVAELTPRGTATGPEDSGVGPPVPPGKAHPGMPERKSQPRRSGPCSPGFLLTPVNPAGPDGAAADLCSPAFPVLGTTPAPGSQAHDESASAPQPCPARATASLAGGGARRDGDTGPPIPESGLHTWGQKGRPSCDCDPGPQATPLVTELVTCKGRPLRGNTCLGSGRPAPEKPDAAGVPACDTLHPGGLQLVSKLKHLSGPCSVDASALWWEVAGRVEPCVVAACEDAVSLWKPLGAWRWEKVCCWRCTEVPVLQLVPVPEARNLVCVALGSLEIREIRALLCSSDGGTGQQVLLSSGNIQAVLGLPGRRLVSSRGTPCDQQVQVVTFAEDGRSEDKQFLMPPGETVLTFAEVQGMREALLGTTVMNNVVVWNLKTGQLLRKMHVGDSPAPVCHGAYSERNKRVEPISGSITAPPGVEGLLFVVLSLSCAKESEPSGSPVFQLMALNPKTTLSVGVMLYCLPQEQAGRFLEGDVKDHFAAAVLTSGTIAIWDLLVGHCCVLPPISDQKWSFVKWSGTDSHLLAGQKDGTVFVYLVG